MFVPGVNGSVIPSAPSSSRLKGAYKNSKKRKMDEGGINIISTLKNLDPNFNKPKTTVNPLVKEVLSSADIATDMLQLAHYSPYPWMQVAGVVGDVVGAGVDLAQSGIASYEGNNLGAVTNIGMASAPTVVGTQGYTRSRSMVNNSASGRYRPLTPLNSAHGANPVIKKGLNWNKAALAANLVEMGQNVGGGYNSTMRVPQRDNAQVKPFIKPRMEEGGKVEDDNDDKEMVDGVASILRGVKSKSNRLQLANKMAKQFNREKVNYDLNSFLKKSKVKK